MILSVPIFLIDLVFQSFILVSLGQLRHPHPESQVGKHILLIDWHSGEILLCGSPPRVDKGFISSAATGTAWSYVGGGL